MPFLKDHNKTAVVYNAQKISYSEVLRNTAYFSSLFPLEDNLKICIFSENRPEWIYSVYSAWYMKATLVIFDYTAEIDEIAFVLNEAAPKLIFCSIACKNKLEKILPLLHFNPKILIFEDLKTGDPNTAAMVEVKPADMNRTAVIAYTSGTTGPPKGVMLSFHNLFSNIQPILGLGGRDDSILAILPFYHGFPLLWTMILPLYAGATIVFVRSLDPKDILNALQSNKVTAISGVPKLFGIIREKIISEIENSFWKKSAFFCAKRINSLWFSRIIFHKIQKMFGGNIRYLICGGAEIEKEVEEDFRTLGFELQTGYGLTETSPMIAFNQPGQIKIGSVGKPLACNEVRIVNGEIVVKGSNVMQGYYLKENETASILKDGWLYTGDLGRLDEDGYLFVTGRKDDMIVLANGKNIDPAKIETGILSVSDLVKEVAIVKNDSKLYAFIYPDYSKFNCPVNMINEEIKWKVIGKYNDTVPDYRKIVSFELTKEELPKTSLGKIKRFKLPQKNSASSLLKEQRSLNPRKDHERSLSNNQGNGSLKLNGHNSTIANSNSEGEINVLTNYINKEKNVEANPYSHLEIDIGLDSLDKVLLLSFIESSFGVKITEEELKKHATLKDLFRYIRSVKDDERLKEAEWKKFLTDADDITIPKTWFTLSLLQIFFRMFFKLFCRTRIIGLQTVPNSSVLFVPNQQCSLDEFIVTCFLKRRTFLNTFYFAKEKHFQKYWKKFLAERHNTILVDIEKDLSLSLKRLAACLNKGKNIIIFPEGTRSVDGSLGEFKPTYSILSCALGISVIPVVIKGTKDFLPKGTLFPRPFKEISVEFLNPVFPDNLTSSELNELVCTMIKRKL
ncbi:MAG: AMP-binding protein [Bacteroidota bacterium]|nr:AMP-binding protein [Bacteroidota bacterium]